MYLDDYLQPNCTLEELGLSESIYLRLKDAEFATAEDIARFTAPDMLMLLDENHAALLEVKEKLEKAGFSFRIHPRDMAPPTLIPRPGLDKFRCYHVPRKLREEIQRELAKIFDEE